MRPAGLRGGVRAMAPLLPAIVLFSASFGVLARASGMSRAAAIVMSATTFAGSAQVATVSILGAGGGVAAAATAALLLNGRYAAIGVSIGSHFRGSRFRRLVEAQLVVDESWAVTVRPDGTLDRLALLGAGGALYVCWVAGTAVGAFVSLGDPNALGFDGAFAGLFLALLVPHLRSQRARVAAVLGAAIAFVLIPLVPAGVPVIAAASACLIGWQRA